MNRAAKKGDSIFGGKRRAHLLAIRLEPKDTMDSRPKRHSSARIADSHVQKCVQQEKQQRDETSLKYPCVSRDLKKKCVPRCGGDTHAALPKRRTLQRTRSVMTLQREKESTYGRTDRPGLAISTCSAKWRGGPSFPSQLATLMHLAKSHACLYYSR